MRTESSKCPDKSSKSRVRLFLPFGSPGVPIRGYPVLVILQYYFGIGSLHAAGRYCRWYAAWCFARQCDVSTKHAPAGRVVLLFCIYGGVCVFSLSILTPTKQIPCWFLLCARNSQYQGLQRILHTLMRGEKADMSSIAKTSARANLRGKGLYHLIFM